MSNDAAAAPLKPLTVIQAISKVMGEIGPVSKEKLNKEQGFKYRGIDDLYNAVQKAMARHGLVMTLSQIARKDNERTTKYGGKLYHSIIDFKVTVYGPNGDAVEFIIPGEAMDSGDKVSNKCMAIADKYAILTLFKVPTDDLEDPDETRPEMKGALNEPQRIREPRRDNQSANKPANSQLPNHAPSSEPRSQQPTPAEPKSRPQEPKPISENDKPAAQDARGELPNARQDGGSTGSSPAKPGGVSEAQIKRLFAIASTRGWSHEQVKSYLDAFYGIASTKDLDFKSYAKIVSAIEMYSFDDAVKAQERGAT